MDLNSISTFIHQFGFPMLVAVYLMWKDSKRDKADAERDERDEKWLDIMHGLVESRNDVTERLDATLLKIGSLEDRIANRLLEEKRP